MSDETLSREEVEVVTAIEPVIVGVAAVDAIDNYFLVLPFENEILECKPPLKGLSPEGIALALNLPRLSSLAKLLVDSEARLWSG